MLQHVAMTSDMTSEPTPDTTRDATADAIHDATSSPLPGSPTPVTSTDRTPGAGRASRPRKPPAGRAADVRAALLAAGGVATHAELAEAVSARAVRTAAAQRLILTVRPGVYGLPAVFDEAPRSRGGDEAPARAAARAERVAKARQAATAARGVLSHRSAAEYYELPLLVDAREAELIVPRGGRVDAGAVPTAGVRRRNLTDAEMTAGVTAPLRTVLDCAADLPGAEALAALDSALRGDDEHPPLVAASQLSDAADAVAPRVRSRVRRLVAAADGRAANPGESALRWIALAIPELTVEPQLTIECGDEEHTVDLGDRRRRIVLEFDSVAWHSSKEALLRDCRRYTALTSHGWIVLRFTWDDVINHPDRTRAAILRAMAAAEPICERCGERLTLGA